MCVAERYYGHSLRRQLREHHGDSKVLIVCSRARNRLGSLATTAWSDGRLHRYLVGLPLCGRFAIPIYSGHRCFSAPSGKTCLFLNSSAWFTQQGEGRTRAIASLLSPPALFCLACWNNYNVNSVGETREAFLAFPCGVTSVTEKETRQMFTIPPAEYCVTQITFL